MFVQVCPDEKRAWQQNMLVVFTVFNITWEKYLIIITLLITHFACASISTSYSPLKPVNPNIPFWSSKWFHEPGVPSNLSFSWRSFRQLRMRPAIDFNVSRLQISKSRVLSCVHSTPDSFCAWFESNTGQGYWPHKRTVISALFLKPSEAAARQSLT